MTTITLVLRAVGGELLRYGYVVALVAPQIALLRVVPLVVAAGALLWWAARFPRRSRGARGTPRIRQTHPAV